MFTGLVEETGRLTSRTPRGTSARVAVATSLGPLVLGESIAVDGVCLTVDTILPTGFEADASSETLARTTLGSIAPGAAVNLERALAVGDRLGGHIVSGHVDGTGALEARVDAGAGTVKMVFSLPRELARFVAEKGSITVNGVSLTVNEAGPTSFAVMLIPHTLKKTSLGHLRHGSPVNLEVDLLARYVARLVETARADAGDPNAEWLARLGRAGML